jgi:hypothetical protein
MCSAACWTARTSLASRRLISLTVSGISPSWSPLWCALYRLCGADDGQERGGGHGQGDLGVPGVVAADLVLVEADLVLRRLEALLDRPPRAAVATRVRSRVPRMGVDTHSKTRGACAPSPQDIRYHAPRPDHRDQLVDAGVVCKPEGTS